MQNLLFICFFILPLRKIVYHICSVPLFLLLTRWIPGTLVAYKIDLIVTKVNGWKQLLMSQRAPSHLWQGSSICLWKAQVTVFHQGLDFTSCIIFRHGFTGKHLSLQSCCINYYLHVKKFLMRKLVSYQLGKVICLFTWVFIKLAKIFYEGKKIL